MISELRSRAGRSTTSLDSESASALEREIYGVDLLRLWEKVGEIRLGQWIQVASSSITAVCISL